jgi:hypothetical protein
MQLHAAFGIKLCSDYKNCMFVYVLKKTEKKGYQYVVVIKCIYKVILGGRRIYYLERQLVLSFVPSKI